MLGFARRAGKLAMGHDMVEQSIVKCRAKLLIFCSDASPGLIREFEKKVEKHKNDIKIIKTDFTMDEIYFSIGYKAKIMTVDDENFSKRIAELLNQCVK